MRFFKLLRVERYDRSVASLCLAAFSQVIFPANGCYDQEYACVAIHRTGPRLF